jgi:hypothetical protein
MDGTMPGNYLLQEKIDLDQALQYADANQE